MEGHIPLEWRIGERIPEKVMRDAICIGENVVITVLYKDRITGKLVKAERSKIGIKDQNGQLHVIPIPHITDIQKLQQPRK